MRFQFGAADLLSWAQPSTFYGQIWDKSFGGPETLLE
jgi:hypothetical protein